MNALFYCINMKRLEPEDFEGHVGTVFMFHRVIEKPSLLSAMDNSAQMIEEDITADLLLTEVTLQKLDPRDRRATDTTGEFRSKPFSLYFESDFEPYLPQGMYEVRNPAFAEPIEIFITCLGPTESKKGYSYQAVFG